MKKIFCILLAVALLAATGCAAKTPDRQIAAARLDQEGNDIEVTIDLSGGWSVEFAAGAFYLYDKAYEENQEAAAIGMTLDREVYEERCAEADASASRRELEGARYYKTDDGADVYLIPVGDDAYLMLQMKNRSDSDEVFARVKAERGMNHAPAAAWTREGYYEDWDGHILSVTRMDDVDEPGWYVGCMLGTEFIDDSWGGMLSQVGDALQGSLPSSGSQEALTVTVTEEGEAGLLLVTEGGESYHFTPVEIQQATIIVNINTEGWGMIAYAEGEETPEIDPEWPHQSAYIGLAEPKIHTFAAAPEAGSVFVKWTRNGEDYATEPVITLLLDESADYVAVFEEDPDWQNPVMNFIGEYQCDRAHALVECFGKDEAWITIEWGGSATELARWIIVGLLDTETMTVEYSGCAKTIVTFDESGEELSQEAEYEDGTGTIVFNDDGTFTWHEDQSEYGTDMVFERVPAASETAREDGERFEAVIILEGMEETVQYEHIIRGDLGFEMDYDYESFERYSDPELESFLSVWDGPGNPENFFEVTFSAEDADTVAAAVREELSQTYDLYEETRELDRAGECLYIEASVLKGTNNMAAQLQMVYIIPTADGCIVATVHCAAEAAEGFARRCNYMINTISVSDVA